MQKLSLSKPAPPSRSPTKFSGSFNANNQGYNGTGRVTIGGPNRNLFVEGQVNGGWTKKPSVGATVGATIRF